MKDDGFTQTYAVEFTPIYELADCPIKIRNKIYIVDWGKDELKEQPDPIKGTPLIRLIDLLYEIFWELSFLGSPKKRDEEKAELGRRVKSIKDGTIEFLDWEEVKSRLKEKHNIDLDAEK